MSSKIITKLFPNQSGIDMSKIQMTDESIYSVTPPDQATIINRLILNHTSKPYPVIDGTANVGGNTIAFARDFPSVIAIEKNKKTYDALANNIRLYGLKNVTTINSDILNYLPKAKKNSILFLDPPWGGPDYKYAKSLVLKLSGTPMHTVIKNYYGKFALIAAKVPFNYNVMPLLKMRFEFHIYPVANYHLLIVV